MRDDSLRLTALMKLHGDAVLRTCYMLCGSRCEARRNARLIFLCAARDLKRSGDSSPQEALLLLLSIAMQLCPCRRIPTLFLPCALRSLMSLPCTARHAAILCLYHGLSASQAAVILNIRETHIRSLLCMIKKRLCI